jgi:dephospho-CoA kinase
MLVIGLTGGIGSGKSTVAGFFSQLGINVIDTDQLSREVTEPKTSGLAAIEQHFGAGILKPDGTLNRSALRQKIFTHPEERLWLEKLLHPMIRKAMHQKIKSSQSPYCIAVIPLLTEVGPDPIIQRILVVDTTPGLQMQRTRQRDKEAGSEVAAILKIQSTREKRLQMAHDIIHNNGSMNDLEAAVKNLHEAYLKLATRKS